MHFRLTLAISALLTIALRADDVNGWQFQPEPDPAAAIPTLDANVDGALVTPNNQTDSGGTQSGFHTQSLAAAVVAPSNVADTVTPEIQNLAASLQNDPIRIFEFVYNAIEYEHYYGSKKGAQLTLLERAGNDMDQCALFVSLLKAAGIPAKYVAAWEIIPYDTTAPLYSTADPTIINSAVTWLGLDPTPFPATTVTKPTAFASWTDDQYKKSLNLANYSYAAGFKVLISSSFPATVLIPRTFVRVTINSTVYEFDPSAKRLAGKSKLDLVAATGFAKPAFLTAAGGTVASSYITGISESGIQTKIQTYTQSLIASIKANRPNDSFRDIIGRPENVTRSFPAVGGWNQFLYLGPTVTGYVPVESDQIPLTAMSSLDLKIDANATYTIQMPALSGKRLSVSASGNTVQIWQDDTVIYSATVTATTFNLTMAVHHPHFATDGTTPIHDGTQTSLYKKSGSYALIYGFAPSKRLLQSRQKILDGYIDQVRVLNPTLVGSDGSIDLPNLSDATLKRQITAELLNVMGVNWLYQTELTNRVAASVNGLNLCMMHRFGRMGQEAGFYVDVNLQFAGQYPRNGLPGTELPYALTFSYLFSALEHGIIDQYNQAANTGVSTDQIFHLANSSTDTNKNRIYRINSTNWSSVQSQLIGYGTVTDTTSLLYKIKTRVDAGSVMFVPRNANNGSSGWNWQGSGYMDVNVTSTSALVGMIISGGYAGGYSIVNSFINPAPVYSSYISSPNYFDTGGVSNIINRTTPSFNFPSFSGADPVDMATGAMTFNKEDLALGQSGVRGLSFQRNYNSNRSNSDASKIGYGWTHSYDMKAVVRTAPEAGLGETTPAEAAPMLAAAAVINELSRDTTDLQQMVCGGLVAKIAIDNLLNNAVSLVMGKDTVQFVKQPDGTYTPPASSTMSLTKSGNYYLATERFGNTYKFDTTQSGRIIEIKDFFTKTLSFAYNTNGLNTITDAYGRVLTFGYTGAHISSISDGTGRTVQFLYTGNDLTSVTDPESKTDTFGYDTQHRLTLLKDPQSRTIIINHYDSEGRVYQQDSQGDLNKSWKLSFTGIRNTETNPLGGQNVFFYDQRGRPIGAQDALGNASHMAYDGQDHMIQRVTAKGETYQQTYDSNQNLIEADNPTGIKTLYQYDTLQRVTKITVQDNDLLTPDRVTNIEYTSGNLSNLPNKITDPKGNVIHRTYYTDGTLNTSTEDSSTGNRTTTFYYDTRGMPQKSVYPDTKFELFSYGVRGTLDSQTDRRNNTTSFLYNNRGQLTQTTQPGNRITTRHYDDSANLDSVTDPLLNVTQYTTSATGKTLTETAAYGTTEAETTTHHYDARDWQDYILDPRNKQTNFEFDAAGRVKSVTDPLTHTTYFQYDANGQRTQTKTPLGYTTNKTYTALGNDDTMTDPATNVVTYGYTGYGERKTLQNRRNKTFQFYYDDNGNPTITKTPLNFSVTKNWNDRNLIGSVVKASTQTTNYVYDDLRRVYTQTDPVGTVTFGYDDNGNPLTVTEGSNILTRTWDALNRPQSYTNARNQTIGYQYYDNGLLWKLTYPGNRVVTYTYYKTNRLKTVTDWANRVTTYTWDTAGRLTGITRPNNVTRTNEFDDAGRLNRIYERDSLGRLLVYFKYGYDDDGRLTTRYRLPKPQAFTMPVSSSVYDDDNRLQTWNGQSVVHDSDGNMTSGPLGATGFVTYNYDARNRLTSVGTVGSGFTNYGYDSENNRISVTTAAGTTQYLIDPHGDALPRVLIREKPDATTTTYVYGIGLLYEVNDTTGDATYYHYDNIGNTAALTGPTGTLTDRIEYSPYGQITKRVGTTDTPFLYVGQMGVQQDANGLLYMRARYYSVDIMGFCNADPSGFSGGLNWYAYVENNPLMSIDSSGNEPSSVGGIGATWAAAAGDRAIQNAYNEYAMSVVSQAVQSENRYWTNPATGNTEAVSSSFISSHPDDAAVQYFQRVDMAKEVAVNAAVFVATDGLGELALAGRAADQGIMLYRGVAAGTTKYDQAMQGLVIPRGSALDQASLVKHVLGEDVAAGVTSWTTNPAVAAQFAGQSGKILQVPMSSVANKVVTRPFAGSKYSYESEVLLRGTIYLGK